VLDAKLRASDVVGLQASDVAPGDVLRARSTVIQQKTGAQSLRAPEADGRSLWPFQRRAPMPSLERAVKRDGPIHDIT